MSRAPPAGLVDLEGLRIAVLGAGSGIGASCTQLAVAAGAKVAASVMDGEEAPSIACPFHCDVTDADAVARTIGEAVDALSGLDAAIVTVGVFDHRGISETDDAEWHRVLRINLDGPFHVARAVKPVFEAAGAGSLVLFASQIGIVGHRRATAYAASKGGVMALSRTLAIEFAAFGARVNAVAPGPIETPMTATARSDPERAAALLAAVPLRRFGKPDEVARAALFLASPASAYVTGHVLVVDGGVTAI